MSINGPGGAAAVAAGASKVLQPEGDDERVRRLGLSPRQQELDRRWGYYRCEQYAARKINWDGSKVVGQTEHDSIGIAGYVPPGFYVANSETLPIQFRKPSTPYHLCKVVVDRFTSLLFGQKRHPKITVNGDPDTEMFANAVAQVGRLWPVMMQARTYGGATGTAVVGFKVLSGRPQFEVFDSRWCSPKFVDRVNFVLSELEYRHTFKQEIRSPETGDWVEVDFWYRRVIDTQSDIVFEPVPVERAGRPNWIPASAVEHKLGFCPVVWIQNQPGDTSVDGDPDCLGTYEMIEAIDRLISQAERGIVANCDPTVVVVTDAQMGEVRKGSNNALKLPANSSAGYMEMSGGGVQQAREQVELYKQAVLEVCQCVLEQPDGQKTATEVERNYAAMLAKADTLREQYGELGVKRLINMVIVASVQLQRPRLVDGSMTRFSIQLPKRPDGKDQTLGKGPYEATLSWPPYLEPSLDDAVKAVQAATGAKAAGLVDQEHATKFIAPFFQVEDSAAVAKKITHAGAEEQAEIERMALDGPEDTPETAEPAEPAETDGGETKEADTALNGAQVTALADLIMSVAGGKLPVGAAKEIIMMAFPVSSDQVDRMLASLQGVKSSVQMTPVEPTTPDEGSP